MISFGIAASSHSGLIPLKTAYKKRGELPWAIASKKNFINLLSDAFDTVLKLYFRIFRKRSHRISSNFAIMEVIMAGTYSLKRFLRKIPGTEKHNDK